MLFPLLFLAVFDTLLLDAIAAPTVQLDNAVFTGAATNGGLISSFLGIPFAKPPIGDLRFRLPQPIPVDS